MSGKPIQALMDQPPTIPHKPKKPAPQTNGVANGQINGNHAGDEAAPKDLKRQRTDEAEGPQSKKAKQAPASDGDDDVVLVDDAANGGYIVVDD